MDDRTAYFNDMLARLEEVLLQELSWCAAWKVELVGTDFIQSRKIEGDTPEKVIENCIKDIKAAGIADDIDYFIGGLGILLSLDIKGCVHIPMEAKLKEDGIKPFMCPIANILMDQLINSLNYEATFLADMAIDESKKQCKVRCAIYETVDKIGQVSDWNKIEQSHEKSEGF